VYARLPVVGLADGGFSLVCYDLCLSVVRPHGPAVPSPHFCAAVAMRGVADMSHASLRVLLVAPLWHPVVANKGGIEQMVYLLAISAGGFLYIALADLLPELQEEQRAGASFLQVVLVLAGLVVVWTGTFLPS